MIGILFATEKEARPFVGRGAPDGVVVAVSGMGMAAARVATESLIQKQGCRLIINAGVCGALKDSLPRGAVYHVSSVANEAADEIDIQEEGLRLISVDEPVFETERKQRLAGQGDLVDMEGYAVAQVCHAHQVPCRLIKGVTDFGDHHGKEDIQTHIDSVSDQVATVVFEIISVRPSFMRKLHSFTKVEHTLFSLPLLFAGAWLGADGMPPLKALLLISLVGLGARTFGMALNRILDRKMDAANPRTQNRELPSGQLSLGHGVAVAAVGLLFYFIGCALLGDLVFKLSLFPLIPLSIYSLLKRFTPLCHYGIGICLATAPLGAFVAVSNRLDFSPAVLWFALFSFCWISGFDIIYALLDEHFDRKHGVHSIPAALGHRGAHGVAAVTHAMALAALVLIWQWNGGIASLVALIAAAGAMISAYLPAIPIPVRFFPISAIAGIAGALVVLLSGLG